MNISQEIQERLLCPVTKSKLRLHTGYLESIVNPSIRYPIIDGIPVLINEDKSLFSISDFQQQHNTTFDLRESKVRKVIKKLMPKITHNLKAKQNYKELNETLPTHAKILVIGGSIIGQQMEVMYTNASFEIIGSDVTFGPQTNLISDAHDIPFADETFDCVIAQAVLEHVLDPQRCVDEMHRVLKPDGIVYA
ncbi:MAG: methyltransferase domain-containing protein, partial [Saprospiraceae bacterium]|nr:methyltransferase domain-containing protein [Saprospiraceae bacterium]